jgi:phage baseplate assembly protein W
MTGPRYRGIRFIQSGKPGEKGLRIDRGDLEMVEDDAALRQAILLLVSTRPGERVMRPGYGCDLQRLVFSPNDDTTAGLAVHYVRRALESWEPRIDILALEAVRDADASVLSITLAYRARATQRRDSLQIRFSLEGGAA